MLKVSGNVSTISLDLRVFNAQFKNDMTNILKEVAKTWLFAASGRVPIWSGMALASLSDVAEYAGTGLLITPRPGIKSRIQLGKIMGSVGVVRSKKLYSITMTTSVPHYVLQEDTNIGISPSAPWRSFPAGLSAVESTIPNMDVQAPKFKIRKISF